MTLADIDTSSEPAPSGGSRRRPAGAPALPDQRLNDLLLVCLVALLAFVPLPLGSNRPPLWAFSATLVGAVGIWYFATLLLRGESVRLGLGALWWPAVLFAAICAALVLQVLPIAQYLPQAASPALPLPGIETPSVAPGATWLVLLQMLGYGLFTFLMLQVGSRRDRATRAVGWLFGIIVVYGALGLLMLTQLGDSYFGIPKQAYRGSVTGPFINRNSFATFLAFGLAAGCALFVQGLAPQRRRGGRLDIVVILAATLLTAVALLATNSRMGIVAGTAGGLVALVLGGIKLGWGARRWALLVLVVLLAGGGLFAYYGTGVLERVIDTEGALESRLELYRQVATMIEARPWLGFGGGTFAQVYPIFHAAPVSSDFVWDRAHSTYLTLWAELGVVAGSLPLLLLAALGWRAAVAYVRSVANWAAGLAAMAVLVVAAVHSTVDFSLEIQANAYFLIAFLALGAADKS